MRRACCASTRCRLTRQRLLERLLDGVLGDLVEHHPEELGAVLAVLQFFLKMEADGFALAIRVSRQVHGVGALGGRFQLCDQLLFAFDHLVNRLEIVVDVHRQILLGQILHVAQRGLHRVVFAQVLPNRFRLRRRLDDDEILCHMSAATFLNRAAFRAIPHYLIRNNRNLSMIKRRRFSGVLRRGLGQSIHTRM